MRWWTCRPFGAVQRWTRIDDVAIAPSANATVAIGSSATVRSSIAMIHGPPWGACASGDKVAAGLDHRPAVAEEEARHGRVVAMPSGARAPCRSRRDRPGCVEPTRPSRADPHASRTSGALHAWAPAARPRAAVIGGRRPRHSRAARGRPRTRASNRPSVIRPARSAATRARDSRRSTEDRPTVAGRSIDGHEIARPAEPRHRPAPRPRTRPTTDRHAAVAARAVSPDHGQLERRAHRPPVEAVDARGCARSAAPDLRSSNVPDAPLEPFDAGGVDAERALLDTAGRRAVAGGATQAALPSTALTWIASSWRPSSSRARRVGDVVVSGCRGVVGGHRPGQSLADPIVLGGRAWSAASRSAAVRAARSRSVVDWSAVTPASAAA